jgi:transposase
MRTFIALDVSLEKTAICIMSADGSVAAEVTAASDPEAIAAELVRQEAVGADALVGLEAGPLSEWIARGLADLGASVTLMETRQIRAALSSMVVKTDRNDARHRAAAPHGLVPPCPPEVDGCLRAARPVGRARDARTAADGTWRTACEVCSAALG